MAGDDMETEGRASQLIYYRFLTFACEKFSHVEKNRRKIEGSIYEQKHEESKIDIDNKTILQFIRLG